MRREADPLLGKHRDVVPYEVAVNVLLANWLMLAALTLRSLSAPVGKNQS
jgi:hypothetical protein